jgi:CBS-domain-containing membrane protein
MTPTSAAQLTRVGEVMTRRLVTIGPEQDLVFANSLMSWSNVRHLPVVRDGALVGVLSDRDLARGRPPMGEPDPMALVADIMRSPPETASPDDDLGEAAARMAACRIDCLPVVDDGRLVGILTTTDVLAERGKLFFKDGRVPVPSVATVMRPAVERVTPDEDLLEATGTMIAERIRHLPVVDDEGRLVGMLSDRDVRSAIGDPFEALASADRGRGAELRVEDAMVRSPIRIGREASLADLTSCLLDERVGAVPVVDDDDYLVGIVSYIDLLRHVMAVRRA